MKPILFALLLLPTAAFAMVPGTGCVYNPAKATCMVSNETENILACDIRVEVTTNKNQKFTKKKVMIMPKTQDITKVIAPWDDKIEQVRIAAICKPK